MFFRQFFGKRSVLFLCALSIYLLIISEIYPAQLVPIVISIGIVLYDRASEYKLREYLRVTQTVLVKRDEEVRELKRQLEDARHEARLANNAKCIAESTVEVLREELWIALEHFGKIQALPEKIMPYLRGEQPRQDVETARLFAWHYNAMAEFQKRQLSEASTMNDLEPL